MNDQERQVREQVLDEIAEVLTYSKRKKWGAQRAIAACALRVSGTLMWHERKRQETAIEALEKRSDRISKETSDKIMKSLEKDHG